MLALALIVFAIDRLVGRQLEARFHVSASDEADAIGRGLESRSPILICGSSRARHHYDPDALQARLGVAAWNLGRDGQFGPYFAYGVAELALRRYTPKLWILEVDERTFAGPDPMSSLNVLLPYAADPAIAELVTHRSRYERLKLLSAIYPYNSLLLSLYGPGSGRAPSSRRGFSPVSGRLSAADTASSDAEDAHGEAGAPTALAANSLKQEYLEKMIRDLERRGVAVVAVRSPLWLRGPEERARDRAEAGRLSKRFDSLGVRFFDLSAERCPSLGDPGLYRDTSHLNAAGAARFSALVADSIASLHLPGLGPGVAAQATVPERIR
jgi:hypothetical protein